MQVSTPQNKQLQSKLETAQINWQGIHLLEVSIPKCNAC